MLTFASRFTTSDQTGHNLDVPGSYRSQCSATNHKGYGREMPQQGEIPDLLLNGVLVPDKLMDVPTNDMSGRPAPHTTATFSPMAASEWSHRPTGTTWAFSLPAPVRAWEILDCVLIHLEQAALREHIYIHIHTHTHIIYIYISVYMHIVSCIICIHMM